MSCSLPCRVSQFIAVCVVATFGLAVLAQSLPPDGAGDAAPTPSGSARESESSPVDLRDLTGESPLGLRSDIAEIDIPPATNPSAGDTTNTAAGSGDVPSGLIAGLVLIIVLVGTMWYLVRRRNA